jgi:KDO2-lipid IV(A) lauroyltransferase
MKNFLVPLIFKSLALLPLGVARGLATCLGYCIWLKKGRSYTTTLKNIRKCFPQLNDQETRKLVRESIIETAKTAIEAGAIWRNSWAWLQSKIVAVEGEEILRAELAQGRGLIVLAPHHGNWEVVAPYLASIAPLTAMYQPAELPALDKLILAGRSKNDITMAPTNRKGVSMLLKALQQGTIVGILPDQVPDKGSGAEPVDFYGHPAMTMSLVHSLMGRTQSRVVAVFAMRVKGGFKLITLAANEAIYNEDSLISLRGLNASVESCINLAPAQYQWEYNRFKGLPKHLRK